MIYVVRTYKINFMMLPGLVGKFCARAIKKDLCSYFEINESRAFESVSKIKALCSYFERSRKCVYYCQRAHQLIAMKVFYRIQPV